MTLRLASCIGVAVLAIASATGCGAARPSKYYQLTTPGDISPSASSNAYPITIVIGALTSSDLYREDRIVYGGATEQMGTYEYQRWAEPPTEMLRDVLLRALRASGHFRGVYSLRGSAMRGDYLLRGRLYDFKELTANSLLARVTLDLELRDEKSGSIVWTHFYSYDQPVNGKDVAAVVSAMNQNVHRGLAEIQASLDQYFARHAQPTP
jgi:ABC-type uncharacterized transport system auxiliary subunit